jgi:long-chain acyl-CoA synthetase
MLGLIMDHAHSPDRPWLRLYRPDVPPELPLPTVSAVEQFRATASTCPDRIALYYFDTPLTFGEIDRLSNALAAALQGLGVRKNDRIALYLQNVPQFWIAELAAWKAGAIVVPLNPMFKERELEFHFKDSGASVVIALESLYETTHAAAERSGVRHFITTSELDYLDETSRPALLQTSAKRPGLASLDLRQLCEQHAGAADPRIPLGPSDVALLTYTSGTTGRPKGAMNTHGNVAFDAEVYRAWAQLGPGDVIVGMAPLFHITGLVSHLATAALTGVPLILSYRFDGGEMLRLIERWRGTFTVAAITAFRALLHHPDAGRRDLSSLRKAYSGGAPIAPSDVEQFRTVTGVYIHNIYGLTETTSPSHGVPLGQEAPVDPDSGALSIGVPVPNTESKIISVESGIDSGGDAPPGTVGELVIRGPGVVAGYWQQPEESARAIRDGWLHTGDVGKMDAQGWFYLVDRKKDMIVASGYKVWPREVEEALLRHEAVSEAAVIGVPDSYRGETVKAFVVLRPAQTARTTAEELIAFCKERLAAYKYPRQIEVVNELPKTATGKVMRRSLRETSGGPQQGNPS